METPWQPINDTLSLGLTLTIDPKSLNNSASEGGTSSPLFTSPSGREGQEHETTINPTFVVKSKIIFTATRYKGKWIAN